MKKINCVRAVILAVVMSTISLVTYAQEEKSVMTPDSIKVTKELNTMDYIKPGKYILKKVNVHGVRYINPDLITNSVGFIVGEEIDIPGDYITSAIRKLWSQKNYSDIKVYVTVEGIDATIDLFMKERPRISKWEFKGVKPGEDKQLHDKLKFNNFSELSDYVIHGAVNNVKAFFIEKGFLNVDVDVTQRNDTSQKIDNEFVILTLNINKGEKMKLKEITFEGNNALSDNKLKSALKDTKEKTLKNIFKTAKFDRKKFEQDKFNLIDYMQSKGYRNAAVLEDSIYQVSDNRLGLKIKVEEGNKYYFRNITFTGNVKHNAQELALILGIQRGDVYDKKNLESRLGTDQKSAMDGSITVSSIYNNAGHLAFQIDPVETVVSGDSIDMDIRISEGKPFVINEVKIIGNTRTTDRVIRRELRTLPGELYSQEMLINSLRQIQSMGHFTDNMNPVPVPVSDGLVDIEFNLEERPNDQFELSGGWGGGVFVASVGVTFNNVAMRNFFNKSAWRPYPTGDNQKLSLRIQTNGSYYQSYQASFFEPWLGGRKPNSFSVSTHYSTESNGNWYRGRKGTGSFATTGVSLSYGKRLSWPDPNFVLSGSFSYQSYLMNNWDRFLFKDGTSNIVTFSGQIERNSIDHPIYPRNGSHMSLMLSVTPPYSLFRSDDFYSDPNLTDRKAYRWIEYYQIDAKLKWYLSTLSNKKLVFMAAADLGYLGHYRNQDKAISVFEGYSLGGDGFSGYSVYGVNNIGLRGYENESLTPNANQGEQARLYNKFTFEVRYPIVMEASTSIYVLAFAEGGNAFYGWREYSPFNLKKAAGVGLRLFLPVVGMFGIDWGYGFNKVPMTNEKGGSQFHFSIGKQF